MSVCEQAKSLPAIYHVCAVIEDVDKTIDFLSQMFGLGPWKNFDLSINKKDIIVGEPCRIKLSGAKLGSIILELIQPVEGSSIWADFLAANGEGLHHVAFSVTDWHERASAIEKRGGKMMAAGFNGDLHWGYFYTSPGGIIVEFEEKSPEGDALLSFPEADNISQPDLRQMGVVVKDLDKSIDFLSSVWELGPWQTASQSLDRECTETIAGEPCKIKVGSADLNPIALELIQPLEGKSFWSQYADANGEGISHITINVSDLKEMTAKLEKYGGKMLAAGVKDGVKWGYFKTKPSGIIIKFEEKVGGKH